MSSAPITSTSSTVEELPPITTTTSSSTSEIDSTTSESSTTTSDLTTSTTSTTTIVDETSTLTLEISSELDQPPSFTTTTNTREIVEETSQPGPSTTVISRTVVVTPSDGGGVTTIVVATTLPVASQSAAANLAESNSDNTKSIVGGVFGGIGGLIILIVLGYFLWRRRRSKELDDFDGNFDPVGGVPRASPREEGGTLPDIHLDDEDDGMSRMTGAYSGTEYNPWMPGSPEMRQTSPPPLNPMYLSQGSPGAPSQYSDGGGVSTGQTYYPHSTHSGASSPLPSQHYYSPMPIPNRNGAASPPHSAASSNSQSTERYIVNPSDDGVYPRVPSRASVVYSEDAHNMYLASGPGPSNTSSNGHGGSIGKRTSLYQQPVIVENIREEIPPTYESIPGAMQTVPPSGKY